MATKVDGFGLNKSARLQAARAAREAAERAEVPPLNPAWPWNMAPFDPWFFGVVPSVEVDGPEGG